MNGRRRQRSAARSLPRNTIEPARKDRRPLPYFPSRDFFIFFHLADGDRLILLGRGCPVIPHPCALLSPSVPEKFSQIALAFQEKKAQYSIALVFDSQTESHTRANRDRVRRQSGTAPKHQKLVRSFDV